MSGFLQGLFLREQLEASERNQQRQIEASERAQAVSQMLAREQMAQQSNEFSQNLALQRQKFEADRQQQQLGNQFSIAQALQSGMLRRPTMQNSFEIGDGPTSIIPKATPDGQPLYAPVQIGQENFVTPTPQALNDEKIQFNNAATNAVTQNKIQMFKQLTGGLNLSQDEIEDLFLQVVMGAPPKNTSLEQLATRAFKNSFESVDPREAESYRAKGMEIVKIIEQIKAAGVRPQAGAPFDNTAAQRLAGTLHDKVLTEAKKLAASQGLKEPTQDHYKRIIPLIVQNAPAELRTRIQDALNTSFGIKVEPNIDQSIESLIGDRNAWETYQNGQIKLKP